MQTSLLLPIILKDLRANRWLFAAFFAATILSTACSFVNAQDLGPLARLFAMLLGSQAFFWISLMLSLLTMARVVHADPPGSDTAFLATRPVSGTTLFFAKLLLTMVALVFIPSAIDAVAKLLLGFETSTVLKSSHALVNCKGMLIMFALCAMTKKLRWFLGLKFVFNFGLGVIIFILIGSFVIKGFHLLNNLNWAELAGIYSFLVSDENFNNRIVLLTWAITLEYAVLALAFFVITWQHYVRPSSQRLAFLFVGTYVGAILILGLTGFVGCRQILYFPNQAKSSNSSIPLVFLAPKLTNLYPAEAKITEGKKELIDPTPSMRGFFSFSNWPEDVHSMAVSNVSVSFSRDGQAVTIPILKEKSDALESVVGILSVAKTSIVAKTSFRPSSFKDIELYPPIFLNTPSQKEIPINFSWPPPGLKNALSPGTGDLTLKMDLAVFQYKTEASLPLQVGETAQFGNHIATVRNVTQHSHHCKCSGKAVTVEIDQRSASPSLTEPVYRLKTRAGLVEASKSIFTSWDGSCGGVKTAKVTLTFPMPSTMEDQTSAPLDEEAMRQGMAEWLKDAELVVSKIVPAGTIQREMPITGEARMRFLDGAR